MIKDTFRVYYSDPLDIEVFDNFDDALDSIRDSAKARTAGAAEAHFGEWDDCTPHLWPTLGFGVHISQMHFKYLMDLNHYEPGGWIFHVRSES